jgi:peptidoglycan/LPS O-acetylase OafA/YrhL
MSEKKNWVKGVDSIRFFLALIVLLSHYRNPFILLFKESGNSVLVLLSGVVSHLFLGVGAVIAFFIISGFVIHYPNKKKEKINVVNFLLRRWLRIGIPMVVVGAIAGYFGYFNNIPVWSLYCEIIYYTLYPLLFRMKMGWTSKFRISFVLSYVVILALNISDLRSFFMQSDAGYNVNYWQLGVSLTWLVGLPCWLLGVVLAEKVDNLNYKITKLKIYTYRALVFGLSMVIFALATHYYLSCIFSLNLFALVLYYWLQQEIVFYKTHEPVKLLEYFGKFSYSLYLCHQLCLIILSNFLVYNEYTYIPYVILSLGISYIIYLLVEYPSHKLAQRINYQPSK